MSPVLAAAVGKEDLVLGIAVIAGIAAAVAHTFWRHRRGRQDRLSGRGGTDLGPTGHGVALTIDLAAAVVDGVGKLRGQHAESAFDWDAMNPIRTGHALTPTPAVQWRDGLCVDTSDVRASGNVAFTGKINVADSAHELERALVRLLSRAERTEGLPPGCYEAVFEAPDEDIFDGVSAMLRIRVAPSPAGATVWWVCHALDYQAVASRGDWMTPGPDQAHLAAARWAAGQLLDTESFHRTASAVWASVAVVLGVGGQLSHAVDGQNLRTTLIAQLS